MVKYQINLLEENIKKLNDKQFPEKTIKLKEEIKKGTSFDKILPEAFALEEALEDKK